MKKLFLVFTALLITHCGFTQWTTSGANIYKSNTGNVGIGTASPGNLLIIAGPGTTLSVGGNGLFNNALTVTGSFTRGGNFQGSLANNSGMGLCLGPATYTDQGSASGATVASNAYAGISTPTFAALNTSVTYTNGYNLYISGAPVAGTNVTITHPFAFYVYSGVSHFGGNVLIGENSQVNTAYILDVNGNARANTLTVNTSGADFVFDRSYNLMSLSGVKKYIAINHRLPGMSSAIDMQTNGLNLGENQTKLLQKTEELTLYLIQKDKELKEQKAAIARQQVQIDLQAKQIEKLEALVTKLANK